MLEQDGVLDLDLAAVSISGAVTLAGLPLPDEPSGRGQIRFVAIGAGGELTIELGTSGAGSYAARVPSGTYDVQYIAVPGSCGGPTPSAMPCGTATLMRAVELREDGVLDVDVPVVQLSGSVTLNGATYPDQATERGQLAFQAVEDDGGLLALPLGSAGPTDYAIRLVPGTYDVSFVGNPAACHEDTPPAAPCNSGTLLAGAEVRMDGVLDLDVPAVRVSGAVTVNGAPMPNELLDRGSLTFLAAGADGSEGDGGTDAAAAGASTRSFGTGGPVAFSMTLMPGTYAVAFAANGELCGVDPLPTVPCVGGTLVSGVQLQMDGVLDVDVPAVGVSGAVTLHGQPLPDADGDRGSLLFTNTAGGSGSASGFALAGPVSYGLRVMAGDYRVDYVANPVLCDAVAPAPLPCTGGTLAEALPLHTDGVFDGDLQRIEVSGAVTQWGAPLPDAVQDRGALTFAAEDVGAGAVSVSLGVSGPRTYALSLWPGTYSVSLAANASACEPAQPLPPLPCIGGVLVPPVALVESGVLDVDVPAVRITGSVTLLGAPLPVEPLDRGSISIERVGDDGSAGVLLPLGTDRLADYGATLMPGRYVFVHAANAGLCAPGGPLPVVPCASQVAHGCGDGT
ncbi:MAG: hypothetical protein OXT09_11720 [Myxococcales bacterium]|nr:hypothetical protein [Myxococcales bacterium]